MAILPWLARHRATLVFGVVVAVTSSGTTIAASFVLGTTNVSSTTTTLKSAVNGPVLRVSNTGTGKAAPGIAISVPGGRPPITVNETAGKATNLNADKLDGYDSTGFVAKNNDILHHVGAVGEPQWGSGPEPCTSDWHDGCPWTGYGFAQQSLGFAPASFTKDPLGYVHLSGAPDCSRPAFRGYCSVTMFTLPPGYRPAGTEQFANNGGSYEISTITIFPSGEVQILPRLTTGVYISLSGITFLAAP